MRVGATRSEPLPAGVVEPGAERASTCTTRPALTAAHRGRARQACRAAPRRVALVAARHGRPRCRCCGSRRCRRKAQDLDQLIRWQVRKAAPFRIEDAQVSLGARRGRSPAAAASSSSRSRAATSSRATSAPARRPARTRAGRPRQLQPDQRGARRPARQATAATGCWSTSRPTTRRWRSCAATT